MPAPEQLKPRPSQRLITFRLNDRDDRALRGLAKRAEMGPSTLARRIIEHYLQEHAPNRGGARS